MSSLNLYLKDKETHENKQFTSFSRNHPIYQAFWEHLSIPYACNGDQFTDISSADIDIVTSALKEDKDRFCKRLAETEKYAQDNTDLINDILSYKEGIEELDGTIAQLDFLATVVTGIEHGYTDFETLTANIC